MDRSVRFLANNQVIETSAQSSSAALDFIRGDLGLTGTKEGCREGDCGACAVILGERVASPKGGASFSYCAMPSCLLALGELEGRHLVTIEGLASGAGAPEAKDRPRLTPVMKAISEANGSQCGFCSPGFVISLSAYLLNGDGEAGASGKLSIEGALRAIEGNLCRCTGYGAIRRAAARLVEDFASLPAQGEARLSALVEAGVLPRSCLAFARGEALIRDENEAAIADDELALGGSPTIVIGGGSDYLVRNPEPDQTAILAFELLDRRAGLKRIAREGGKLSIGAAVNWREFFASPELRSLVPGIERFEDELASPLVRERATVGGNIVNASPVGDLTSILIGLGAILRIAGPGGARREIPIERFFIGYKRLDLSKGEILEAVLIPAQRPFGHFNFEKVSKREHLDIAAVNSAAVFELDDKRHITRCRISAGGVAATPLLLEKTDTFLMGKGVDAGMAREASRIAGSEVKPISDVRGSADYRRRLLERLVIAHFIELSPGSGVEEALK
jgi:xanthine dehydrogenase small subunit